MERESSKECSAFFLWRKGSFSSRNRPSRNSTLFSSRRSAWSVLKCNQGSQVFAEFLGTFCTLWPRQLRFLKGIYVFLNVSQTFYNFFCSALKKNYKMCPNQEMDFVLNFAMCSADFTFVNGRRGSRGGEMGEFSPPLSLF